MQREQEPVAWWLHEYALVQQQCMCLGNHVARLENDCDDLAREVRQLKVELVQWKRELVVKRWFDIARKAAKLGDAKVALHDLHAWNAFLQRDVKGTTYCRKWSSLPLKTTQDEVSLQCELCRYDGVYRYSMEQHFRFAHLVACVGIRSECGKQFETEGGVYRHFEKHRRNATMPTLKHYRWRILRRHRKHAPNVPREDARPCPMVLAEPRLKDVWSAIGCLAYSLSEHNEHRPFLKRPPDGSIYSVSHFSLASITEADLEKDTLASCRPRPSPSCGGGNRDNTYKTAGLLMRALNRVERPVAKEAAGDDDG